jgi:DNA gyrase subunit A
MEIGTVRRVDIDDEMQHSFMDYAMSVIVARALPDARDGLKPVQRRILYAMHDMGLTSETSYKKSARIVGEVLGKYHPHGDMAVYDSMARLAQPFSMRYCMVDGQGNFGSVDGDPPAAMRYTEAKLTSYSMELINHIEKNTVDFSRNFDDTLNEPDVLPSAIPNLLVNGAIGIAIGMATNIPPHHLGEVIDALVYMSQHWEKLDDVSISHLMQFIKGPDFPTGGILLEEKEEGSLLSAYATGKGKILIRGKVDVEEMSRGRSRLIISELPYLTNKASLIERIAELVREGHLEGISDLRDESDRHGMRIVIELKQNTDVDSILKELYHRTSLQTTFGINILALVNGEPRLLTLKQALRVYLEHRQIVTRRRIEFELDKARQRLHILEGLRIAITNLDEIIKLIKKSADADEAKDRLMKKYKFSTIQAQAILDMPLRRLAALERKKIEDECKYLLASVKEFELLLKSAKKLRQLIEAELTDIKEEYSDRRRTQIVSLKKGEQASEKLTATDLAIDKNVWIGISQEGKIARLLTEDLPRDVLKQQMSHLIQASTLDTIYLINKKGQAGAIVVHNIPGCETPADGIHFSKLLPFDNADEIAAVITLPKERGNNTNKYLVTITEKGMVKKSLLQDLPGPSAHLFPVVKINDEDSLINCALSDGSNELLVMTEYGYGIRFSEEEVREMGLIAAGVNGIKLLEGKRVIDGIRVMGDEELLLVSNLGRMWRMAVKDFPMQGRHGQGVVACRLESGQRLIGILCSNRSEVGLISNKKAAPIGIGYDMIPIGKRAYTGKHVIELKEGDEIRKIMPVITDGTKRPFKVTIKKTASKKK